MNEVAYIYTKQSGNQTKYRVYYMYQSKKIYIGLYETYAEAEKAYQYVATLMTGSVSFTAYTPEFLTFDKFVTLLNARDNHTYFHTPIYIEEATFKYFLSPERYLLFDLRDLLYLAN